MEAAETQARLKSLPADELQVSRLPVHNRIPGAELRDWLARELQFKLSRSGEAQQEEPEASAQPAAGGGAVANSSRRLDELIDERERSWLEQKTVIVDIRNGPRAAQTEKQAHKSSNRQTETLATENNKEPEPATKSGHQEAKSTRQDEQEKTEDRASRLDLGGTQPVRPSNRVPTFGRVPAVKLTRLPYFSYHGKARNVDLVSSADRKHLPAGRYTEIQQSDDSPSSSQRSLTDSSPSPSQRKGQGQRASTPARSKDNQARRPARDHNGYSNISNLFPTGPARRQSESLNNLSRPSRPAYLADQPQTTTSRRNSISHSAATGGKQAGSKIRSLHSLNQSPVETSNMRRQNSAIGQQQQVAAGYNKRPTASYFERRPASTMGYLNRSRRSPSASSLYYGSAGVSPYGGAGEPLLDPDCPVHGYSPLGPRAASRSHQTLAAPMVGYMDDDFEAANYYGSPPYHERPAYSPGSPVFDGGAASRAQRGAYYNNASRFSLYHQSPASEGGGLRSSLAPPGEQLRRILGRHPSREPKPVHLHPQWAYTRPFIHLQGAASGSRSPSPTEFSPDGHARPRFQPFNQLQDSQAIRAVDFHPSGQVYAVGSNSRALRICAYPAEHELRNFGRGEHVCGSPRVLFKFLQLHRGSIYCVRFNSTGQLLATGSNDQTVHLVRYNSATHSPDGDEYRLTMHDGTVRDLCFIDDTTNGASLLLSAGGGDNKIYVTDCDTVTPFQSMAGHTQMVMALDHWAGAQFVSASQDRTIRLWDLRTRACTSIISAPPGAALVAGAQGATLSKWAGPGAPVCSVKMDPSGRLLASGHTDSTCMLYDIRGAKVIQAFKPHEDEIRTVSFSPKSYYLLTSGYDGRILLSDLQGDLTRPLPSVCVAESADKIVQSKWHPSDFTFVTTSADKTATLWALPTD